MTDYAGSEFLKSSSPAFAQELRQSNGYDEFVCRELPVEVF
jgi:hypothetical protein